MVELYEDGRCCCEICCAVECAILYIGAQKYTDAQKELQTIFDMHDKKVLK